MVSICTIIARNYLAQARVLARSFANYHPEGILYVLVVDDEAHEGDFTNEPFTALRLSDIGLNLQEIRNLATIYDVVEFATAVKPLLLKHLLKTGHEQMIYLDPDIQVFASLEPASLLAKEHGIVLTPHMSNAAPDDGLEISNQALLGSGVFNLGFIAVSCAGLDFLDWWWSRTRRFALVDIERMMFTDQRWIDLAPSIFPFFVLKDPGYNVAWWNLHERFVTCEQNQFQVEGYSLRFFHFSGYHPLSPHLLSRHQRDRPRVLLSERPEVAQLSEQYSTALLAEGFLEISAMGYGWDEAAPGIRMTLPLRRLYRQALLEHEQGKAPAPPNPFDRGVDYLRWLTAIPDGSRRQMSRYAAAVYDSRRELQENFPDVVGIGAADYHHWLTSVGSRELDIEPILLEALEANPPATLSFVQPEALCAGVNLTGYLHAELGIGEASRLLACSLEACHIPYSPFAYRQTHNRQDHEVRVESEVRAPHDVNIVCVNADMLPTFAREVGPAFFDGRYNVGYWWWELQAFPSSLHSSFDFVDEVWCATKFVADAIRRANRASVFTMPLPLYVARAKSSVQRTHFDLSDDFLFLFSFDFSSSIERKNPEGVIEAFCQAFEPNEGPTLLIKSINGKRHINDLERLRYSIRGRADIRIMDDYLSASDKNALLGLCDCYVSLHRSEGLGLGMAEAMGLGKPVIATGYSGNLDFMTPENSFLVDYTTGYVSAQCPFYPQGESWAEPSKEDAVRLMRQVYDEPKEAARRALLGQQDILTKHGVEACGPVLLRRLEAIRKLPRRSVSFSARTEESSSTLPALELSAAEMLLQPRTSVRESSKFPKVRHRLQRLLLQVLQPYWRQQRRLCEHLVSAIRFVHAQATESAAQNAALAGRLDDIEQRVRKNEGARTNERNGNRRLPK